MLASPVRRFAFVGLSCDLSHRKYLLTVKGASPMALGNDLFSIKEGFWPRANP